MSPIQETITQLEKRFEAVEGLVEAFVPESGRFERLHKDAEALEKSFPDENKRPALFGKLVGVKDIFHVGGFETHAGSKLPVNVLSGDESEAVTRLKAQGVLIVGKTVTTEFAYFGPGPTHNPHNLAHTPGGSSSGSAAAVAAGLCDISFGTQTIGSVNRPAAFCGVSGYKPSYDRISRRGVIPLSGSFDHVGLFGKTVSDMKEAAARLNRGWQSSRVSDRPSIAVPTGPYLNHAEKVGLQHLLAAADRLREAGFEVIELPTMHDFQTIYDRHQLVVAAEAAAVHKEWYARYADRYHFKTVELIEKGQKISDSELSTALKEVKSFRMDLSKTMKSNNVDVWLTPAAPGPAPSGLASTGNPVMNLPWTQAGFPTLTIPSGRDETGLPIGVQIVGRWFKDEDLFNWGEQIEAEIGKNLAVNL